MGQVAYTRGNDSERLAGKLEGRIQLERRKLRWEDNIEMYLKRTVHVDVN